MAKNRKHARHHNRGRTEKKKPKQKHVFAKTTPTNPNRQYWVAIELKKLRRKKITSFKCHDPSAKVRYHK